MQWRRAKQKASLDDVQRAIENGNEVFLRKYIETDLKEPTKAQARRTDVWLQANHDDQTFNTFRQQVLD